MGRHRIPDPEESSGGRPEGAGDETESFDQPLVPRDEYPGYQPGPPEPEYPRYGDRDYEDSAESGYGRSRYPEPRYP
ncbi:MAG: hypothetical protein WAL26_14165, partial [Mycobacterium sp.]